MEWLIPSNPKIYDTYKKLMADGYVQWSQHNKYAIGDIIYIYESRIKKIIRFKCIVTKNNILRENVENDMAYYIVNNSSTSKLAFEFHLLQTLNKEITSIDLKENGMGSRTLQGAWGNSNKLNKQLFSYIDDRFNNEIQNKLSN